MRWFCNNRWATRLALFALTFQLALSFGHVHADQLVPSAGITLTATTDTPSDHHQGRHDDCAICAVVHLAGNLVMPPPAIVPLPEAIPATWIALPELFVPATRGERFRARDPPQA